MESRIVQMCAGALGGKATFVGGHVLAGSSRIPRTVFGMLPRNFHSPFSTVSASPDVRDAPNNQNPPQEEQFNPGESFRDLLNFARQRGIPDMVRSPTGAAYFSWHAFRSAFFLGHLDLVRQVVTLANGKLPGLKNYNRLFGELLDLYKQDFDNIQKGYYKLPYDMEPNPARNPQINPVRVAAMLASFASEGAKVLRRRQARNAADIWLQHAEFVPDYYRRNFHYQTDGYLSEYSAKHYDYLVESLFVGGADAMRRHTLVPLHQYMRGRDPANTAYLEVACGTGRSLSFVKDNYPALKVTAFDLSPFYLAEARRTLAKYEPLVEFVQGRAEKMPFADESFDVINCIYLFHEIPDHIRREAAREFWRVLKPGGIVVLMDSLQLGDRNYLDDALKSFPQGFHEPFYMSYIKEDLAALFAEAGAFELVGGAPAFAFRSKQFTFRKPRPTPPADSSTGSASASAPTSISSAPSERAAVVTNSSTVSLSPPSLSNTSPAEPSTS